MNKEPRAGEYYCKYDSLADPSVLIEHPKNPHFHPDKQVKALSHVIDLVGWRNNVVVSKASGFIVYGHCRRLTAILRGELVPVEYQDFGSEAEELAALMADNLIPELAEYDDDLRASNLDELIKLDFELDPLDDDLDSIDNDENHVKNEKLNKTLIVEVQCLNEIEQQKVFEMLKNKGYKCRVLGI